MNVGEDVDGGNLIIEAMTPDCREFVADHSLTKPIASGEVIHEPGAPLQNMVFPHDGQISVQYLMKEGRTVEMVAVGADGAVGIDYLLGGERYRYLAVTVISGRASWLPIKDFQTALQQFSCVRPAMAAYIERRGRLLMQAVACASVHTAIQRLSTWLLHADDRTQADSFDITQRMLADILGFRLATISESCNKLLGLGAIHYSRGTLSIVDRALLEAQSCECYEAVRLGPLEEFDADWLRPVAH